MNEADSLPDQSRRPQKRAEDFLNGGFGLVSVEEALTDGIVLLDVRTAEEFAEGSVPDALSRPLFDNMERAEIGTIYKQIGRYDAVEKGLEFFEPKIQQFLESISDIKSQQIVVFCARGGMRSSSVVRLLQHHGFRVAQMQGGYKTVSYTHLTLPTILLV